MGSVKKEACYFLKMQIFNSVPTFNDKQIDGQLEKQLKFLKTVYPFLDDLDNWGEGCIELRPLKRDWNAPGFIRSYNAWHIQEKDVEHLRSFLKMLNGKGYCLYYSCFAFDYHMDVYKENGKMFKKGRINNTNALFTCTLPMDFDNITDEEFKIEKQRLTDLGLQTTDVFTGHGFQSLILLNEKVRDKDILEKFTKLLIQKGFRVDDALVDSARILRMPFSFNCKAMDKGTKYYDPFDPDIIPTTVVEWSLCRYHVVDVFSKINSLPDVIPPTNPFPNPHLKDDLFTFTTTPFLPSSIKTRKKDSKEIKEINEIDVEHLKILYDMLDFERLQEPIQKMLGGSQDGIRNMTIMFLVPFLRNSLGLDYQSIQKVMAIWGERCTPQIDPTEIRSTVERIYQKGFKGKVGRYTKEMAKAYGYIEFNQITKKDKILIPNGFLKGFPKISDCAVRIYLALKRAEQLYGKKEFSKKEILNYAEVSERTLERNMKCLVTTGYVCKRRGVHGQKGQGNMYYINPYFSMKEGFTLIDIPLVEKMLDELTDPEIKLYCFFCHSSSKMGKRCLESQMTIAENLGKKSHSSISKITDSLRNKGYISKTTDETDKVKHSSYSNNY
jgi:hypothetical protein